MAINVIILAIAGILTFIFLIALVSCIYKGVCMLVHCPCCCRHCKHLDSEWADEACETKEVNNKVICVEMTEFSISYQQQDTPPPAYGEAILLLKDETAAVPCAHHPTR